MKLINSSWNPHLFVAIQHIRIHRPIQEQRKNLIKQQKIPTHQIQMSNKWFTKQENGKQKETHLDLTISSCDVQSRHPGTRSRLFQNSWISFYHSSHKLQIPILHSSEQPIFKAFATAQALTHHLSHGEIPNSWFTRHHEGWPEWVWRWIRGVAVAKRWILKGKCLLSSSLGCCFVFDPLCVKFTTIAIWIWLFLFSSESECCFYYYN